MLLGIAWVAPVVEKRTVQDTSMMNGETFRVDRTLSMIVSKSSTERCETDDKTGSMVSYHSGAVLPDDVQETVVSDRGHPSSI